MASERLSPAMRVGLVAWLRGDGDKVRTLTTHALRKRGYINRQWLGYQRYGDVITDKAVAWGQPLVEAGKLTIVDPRPKLRQRRDIMLWCRSVQNMLDDCPSPVTKPEDAARWLHKKMRDILDNVPDVVEKVVADGE